MQMKTTREMAEEIVDEIFGKESDRIVARDETVTREQAIGRVVVALDQQALMANRLFNFAWLLFDVYNAVGPIGQQDIRSQLRKIVDDYMANGLKHSVAEAEREQARDYWGF
jgi:hypothetical protein